MVNFILNQALTATSVLALCIAATPATAQNRVIAIHNLTGTSIFRVYYTNSGNGSWGPDRLGSATIPAGVTKSFSGDDGSDACTLDVKVVYANGITHTKMRVNFCTAAHIDAVPRELVIAY